VLNTEAKNGNKKGTGSTMNYSAAKKIMSRLILGTVVALLLVVGTMAYTTTDASSVNTKITKGAAPTPTPPPPTPGRLSAKTTLADPAYKCGYGSSAYDYYCDMSWDANGNTEHVICTWRWNKGYKYWEWNGCTGPGKLHHHSGYEYLH
jgi:hypothetical protein